MAADDAGPLFTCRFHVMMADTDGLGILYYAAPLLWAKRVLTSWRPEAWMPLTRMFASGIATPVVHTEISYRAPLALDDEVEATLWPVGRSERSFTVLVRFADAASGRTATEVRIKQAVVRLEGGGMRSTGMPPDLAAALDAVAPVQGERPIVRSRP